MSNLERREITNGRGCIAEFQYANDGEKILVLGNVNTLANGIFERKQSLGNFGS